MKLNKMILCGLLLAGGQGLMAEPLSAEQVAQIRAKIKKRQLEFFAWDAGEPLVRGKIKTDKKKDGDYTRKYNQSIVLFAFRCMELGEQLDEANAAIREMCQYHLDRPNILYARHSFPGNVQGLARIYHLYGPRGIKVPNRLSKESSSILEKTMWEWVSVTSKISLAEIEKSRTWWLSASENHHALEITSNWMITGMLGRIPAYRDQPMKDGHTVSEHYHAWTEYLKEYYRQRAKKGMFVEIDSPSYATATLRCIYQVYDLAEDPVLKRRADDLLALYWTLWVEEQIQSVAGGAQIRAYLTNSVRNASGLAKLAYYVLGMDHPGQLRTHAGDLPLVTTTWQAPAIVLQIIFSMRQAGPFEIRQRRMGLAEKGYVGGGNLRFRQDFGGLLRYTYRTPDFVMGSLVRKALPLEAWTNISCQNIHNQVIFAGDPDARVFARAVVPNAKTIYNACWSIQAKGTQISQILPLGGKGAKKGSWRVFFSAAGLSKPLECGHWIFAEATNAYVGVRVVDGGFSFEKDKYGLWAICENKNTPVIIEAGRKSGYQNFEAFQTAAIARPLVYKRGMVAYESLGNDKLTFDATRSSLPNINGTPVDLAPAKVYDSPFVQSKWDSDVVTIQCGDEKRSLDFSE